MSSSCRGQWAKFNMCRTQPIFSGKSKYIWTIVLTSDVTLGFAAGKVCRNRMGSIAKRLMKIHKMETQNWDRLLSLVDSIWDKWTRNKVNVKILIWVILLRWLYLSDKFWSNCPQKVPATSSTGRAKALCCIWNETEKPHYYYLYHKEYESLSYLWRQTHVHYFQSGSGNYMIFHQRRQTIYYFTVKWVLQISLWLRVKWWLPGKKKLLLITLRCIYKESSPYIAFYYNNCDQPPCGHQQIFCAADTPSRRCCWNQYTCAWGTINNETPDALQS